MERGFLTTSMTNDLPMESAVTFAPTASLIRKAASTAFSSKPLRTGGVPCDSTTRLVPGSTLKADAGISGSSTCLTHTMMFMGTYTVSYRRWVSPLYDTTNERFGHRKMRVREHPELTDIGQN